MLLLIGSHDTDGQDNVTVELDIVLVGQVVSESCSVTVLVGVSLLDVEAESFFLCIFKFYICKSLSKIV